MRNKRKHLRPKNYKKRPRTPELDVPEHIAKWDTPDRAAVRQLRLAGHTQSSIRELTGLAERTQRKWKNVPSTRRAGKHRPGRPPKIDQDTVQKMIKSLKGHYYIRI